MSFLSKILGVELSGAHHQFHSSDWLQLLRCQKKGQFQLVNSQKNGFRVFGKSASGCCSLTFIYSHKLPSATPRKTYLTLLSNDTAMKGIN